MGDTLITIIAIFLAATLMFVFPRMSLSERTDDITQLNIQTLTTQFVDNIRTTGKFTEANYGTFIERLAATGNAYDVELEFKIQDSNPGRKPAAGTSTTKIGENLYYSEYTSQILEETRNNNCVKNLKEGDIVSVKVKNTNKTISEMLRNFFYSLSGDDTYQIAASHSGVVMSTGR